MQPLDLRTLAGKRYRIGHDESRDAEHGDGSRAVDLWLLILPGARGHVYPHSDKLLGVATNTAGPTAKAIASLPGVEIVQQGDDGWNMTFPPALLPKVANLIKLRTRRQLSAEHKAKLLAASKPFAKRAG